MSHPHPLIAAHVLLRRILILAALLAVWLLTGGMDEAALGLEYIRPWLHALAASGRFLAQHAAQRRERRRGHAASVGGPAWDAN